MKTDRDILNQYDDALPERFSDIHRNDDAKKLHIHQGAGNPSPYIVKLSRDNFPARPTMTVAEEIEALAKSLIIDGDDDQISLESSQEHEDLGIDFSDISEQLREFDTVMPWSEAPRSKHISPKPVAPSISLDDALAAFIESPVSLEALVPMTAIAEEQPLESIAQEQFTSDTPSSPWVVASPIVVRESQSYQDPSSTMRRVLRFEWGFLRHAPVRALAAFVMLSFVVVLPLHAMQTLSGTVNQVGAVKDIGIAALDDVSRATSALSSRDFGAAQSDFSAASAKFADAQDSFNDMPAGVVALVNVIPQTDRTYESVRGLITAGQELSQTASIMTQAGSGISSQTSTDIVTKLNLLGAYIENALPHALAAQAALAKVDSNVVPAQYTEKIVKLQSETPAIAASMQEFLKFVHTLTFLLGGESKMRYLTLFQNNTELRPTGGFVGSFAEIDMDNGAIANMRLPGGGTYDVQGQLDTFVEAPQPLSLINSRWEFQDGNWFPDFPTSAKKMQWFYEHAGGPTTDGVVAVNATFIEKLIGLVGPIEMPEYGLVLDSENFLFATEKAVEIDADKTKNTPKAILGDMAPMLIDKVKAADAKTLIKIVMLIEQGLAERDIQVYFRDNDAQKVMQDLGFSGSIEQTDGDYLMVVNTNIGGGKTDAVIDQTIDLDVNISESGTIVDDLTYTKTHHGMANALFSGRNNVDYVRFYVPEGSVLLSADGFEPPAQGLFEPSDIPLTVDDDLSIVMSDQTRDALSGMDIWNEFGKTVFGGWVQTAPGETQVIRLSYRIPQVLFSADSDTSFLARARRQLGFDNHDGYSLLAQKQSGVVSRTTTVRLNYPSAFKTHWTNVATDDTDVSVFDNTRDAFSGWILTR